jgi:iron complex transport system ATP-binding protein
VSIRIKNLSYSFGDSTVLSKICLHVKKGEFFTIIGPNGSGKTTLMKLSAGILKSKNQIIIAGKPIEKYGARHLAKTIAFVPQQVPVQFPFSVREIVLSGRAPHQGLLGLENRKDTRKVEEAIHFTGLQNMEHRKIDQLSGGECQRVFIAAAICQGAGIILLDEPTSALDLAHQVRIMDLMVRLKKEHQKTIVMISHDINLASMYSDTICLMKKGHIAQTGSPEKVLDLKTLEEIYGCRLMVDNFLPGNAPGTIPLPEKYH